MQNCNVKDLTNNLPLFEIPNKFENADMYLQHLVTEGLSTRYPNEKAKNIKKWEEITNRAEHELSVIIQFGLTNYFLIVADYVKWAKKSNIPVGPGRGTFPSSIVAYALGITTIDPLKYNLLFERFINPKEIKIPDFEINFGVEEYEEVLNYIKEKYGKENVGKIIAHGKMKDGSIYTGIHPTGIVISKTKLQGVLPVKIDSGNEDIIIQYDCSQLEKIGFIKIDFLSLKILDIIRHTEALIRFRCRGKEFADFDIEKILDNDPVTLAIFREGNTDNVFGFESDKMKEFLVQAKPDSITDLMALYSLHRPGLSEHIQQFIDSKNGNKEIVYPHPSLKEILEETYGVIVYQEQIIQIIQRITGYSLGKATILWRMLMKKKKEDIEKESFISNAITNSFEKEQATYLFDMLLSSSGYSFNKSHAAAYTKLAYQAAYLKANFPKEYLEAYGQRTRQINI